MEVSQNYNDNVNNPETELCFHCHTYKLKTEFTNPESGFVCDKDYAEMQRLMKATSTEFKEVPGRIATSMSRRHTITDVYAIRNGEEYHLGGYESDKKGFDLNHAKSNIFNRKMQFLTTNIQEAHPLKQGLKR